MRILIFLSLTALVNSVVLAQEGGCWCQAATGYDTQLSVPSPHGKYVINVDDTMFSVTDISSGVRLRPAIGICAPSEFAWSPDDSLFFVNQSNGGLMGTWSLQVYRIAGDSLVEIRLSRDPLKDFKKKMKVWCPDEFPDIVGAGWVEGGAKILVVGVVPNHSSCKGMGNIYCYLVGVHSGRIVDSFGAKALKENWYNIIGRCLKDWTSPGDD